MLFRSKTITLFRRGGGYRATAILFDKGQRGNDNGEMCIRDRLFSEYDQKTKFYNKKKELVHAEIMLPSHAPPGYADPCKRHAITL